MSSIYWPEHDITQVLDLGAFMDECIEDGTATWVCDAVMEDEFFNDCGVLEFENATHFHYSLMSSDNEFLGSLWVILSPEDGSMLDATFKEFESDDTY